MKSSLFQCQNGGEHLLYLGGAKGGAKGGATVSLYQNGGCDEPLQMRLARSPQRSLHRPDLFPHTPGYDLFPCTVDIQAIVSTHVETVCALSKLDAHQKITVDLKKEHTGLNVSNLYIEQVKQKCGIKERANYNKPKSENSRQPKCPPEKEKAIMEALKHFQMI